MKARLKSALLGISLAVPISIYAVHQQEVNAEAYMKDLMPVAEVRLVEINLVECAEEIPEEETVYFDVPISEELQDHIFAECEKHNISPALVIAMIERESRCDSQAVGDGGASQGLMQIQQKWHQERMDRLGCDNLLDPLQNVTVGIDYLHELFQMDEDVYWVLMAYNGGFRYANERVDSGNYSTYAVEVAARASELEGGEWSWN